MTPAAVIAWHKAEAQRYVLIAQNWTGAIEALQGDANGVRRASFHQAAKLAMQTAQQHLDMAHAIEPLMGEPPLAEAVRAALAETASRRDRIRQLAP